MTTDRTTTAEREQDPRDDGMTLIELLVTMGIFAVIGTIIAAVTIVTMKTSAGLQNRQDDAIQGELGLAAASKVLRTAVLPDQLEQLENQTCTGCQERAVLTATTTRVSFYADLGNSGVGPSLVTLRVEQDPNHAGTGRLMQDTQPPIAGTGGGYSFCVATAPGCVVKKRELAHGFVWPSPGIFAFYDYNGSLLAGPTLAAADLPRVQSIDLIFAIKTEGLGADHPTRTAVTRVRLPNVEISINTDGAI